MTQRVLPTLRCPRAWLASGLLIAGAIAVTSLAPACCLPALAVRPAGRRAKRVDTPRARRAP